MDILAGWHPIALEGVYVYCAPPQLRHAIGQPVLDLLGNLVAVGHCPVRVDSDAQFGQKAMSHPSGTYMIGVQDTRHVLGYLLKLGKTMEGSMRSIARDSTIGPLLPPAGRR